MHERSSIEAYDELCAQNGGLPPTRTDPETGEEQVLLLGHIGPYWQFRSSVTIDESGRGQHIDWD